MKFWLKNLGLLFLLGFSFVACNKPALYGTNQPSKEVNLNISVPPQEAFRAVKESLIHKGYSLKEVDETKMTIETFWQPSTADSHYVEVFGRRDYGTVGAYYRLIVRVTPRGSGSRVGIMNVAKTFISNVKSSNREEEEILKKVSDFTRKKDIEVTNIGIQ